MIFEFPDLWPAQRRLDIRRGLRVVVQPTGEPITLETARSHMRLDPWGSPLAHPDDDLITGIYLPAARESCEQYLGRSLAPQTFEYSLSRFPGSYAVSGTTTTAPTSDSTLAGFQLPMAPLIAVESIIYTDSDGAAQTLSTADYGVDLFGSVIQVASGVTWPNVASVANAVVVRYQAGYSLPGDSPQDVPMPAAIRASILLMCGHLYAHREAAFTKTSFIQSVAELLPLGVQDLLKPHQIRLPMA